MKKILIIIITAALVFIAINVLKDENQNLTNSTQNSVSNMVNSTDSQNTQNNIQNNEKEENSIIKNEVVENNSPEPENIIQNEVQNDEKNGMENEENNQFEENVIQNENNKVPDNSYVGEEENSKDDYDTELEGENKAIVLVKKHLGDKASKYTFNVETVTSSAYVVRAMDENSSNIYFSVNFTTWVVSEI